jgi:hypothetical protein
VRRALALLSLLFAVTPGCTARIDPTPATTVVGTAPAGQVVVDWTIRSQTDPGDCRLSSASSISIHVVTLGGRDAGTYAQACDAFSTSIALDPGDYEGTARLIDGAGQPRTTTVVIAPFSLWGNDVFQVPIDFPAPSFF